MSEGSSNVTSGVAMREPMLGKPTREPFEKLIDQSIKATSKKKIEEVLKESYNTRLSNYDEVEVNGRRGVINGTVGPFGSISQITVKFEDGSIEGFDPRATEVKVLRGYPGYAQSAQRQFADAKTGYRLNQDARTHKSNAEAHENMAKHYDWIGEKAMADRERKAADLHRRQEKEALARDAMNTTRRNKYEESSRTKMLDDQHKQNQKIAKAAGTTYRHYYKVPFEDKDKAKAAGFKWDAAAKLWFMPSEMYHNTASPGHDLGWKFLHTYDTYHDKTHK